MGLVVTVTSALVVWIILWAADLKSIVAFLIATVIIMLGATVKLLAPYLPGRE